MVLQYACNTTRQGTGCSSKTSPSSPSRLFSPSASCWSSTVSSIKRPRRRAEQTSPPHCSNHITIINPTRHPVHLPQCAKCGYSHPITSAQPKAKNVTTAVAGIIIMPRAGAEDPCNNPTMPEAQSIQTDHSEEMQGQITTRQQAQIKLNPDRHSDHSLSWSPSHSPSPHWSTRSTKQKKYPLPNYLDSIKVIPAHSPTDSEGTSEYPKEGSLLVEQASNGHVLFYTNLMLPTGNGMKTMIVKIDPGAQVNILPLEQVSEALPQQNQPIQVPRGRLPHPN